MSCRVRRGPVACRCQIGFSKNVRLSALPPEYDENQFWVFVIRHRFVGVAGSVPASQSRLTGLNRFFSLDAI